MTRDEAQQMAERTFDIGMHAGQEAFATMQRVIDTLYVPGEKTYATALAMAYMLHKIGIATETSKRYFPEFENTVKKALEKMNSLSNVEDAVSKFETETGLDLRKGRRSCGSH